MSSSYMTPGHSPAEEAWPLPLTPTDLACCHPSRQTNFIRALRESGTAVLPVSENAEEAMPAYAAATDADGASEHVLLTFNKKGAQVVDMLMKWLKAKDPYLNTGIRACLRVRLIPQLRLLNRECSELWATAAEKKSPSWWPGASSRISCSTIAFRNSTARQMPLACGFRTSASARKMWSWSNSCCASSDRGCWSPGRRMRRNCRPLHTIGGAP